MLFVESMESTTCTGSAATLDWLSGKLNVEPLSELSAVLKASPCVQAGPGANTLWVVSPHEQSYRNLMLEVVPVG